jgi:putative transposase
MKRKRFTEEQIISILKEHEAGSRVPDLARHHGEAENTIYRWKWKYGGMKVSDAKRLRALESENSKLKRRYADAMLDNQADARSTQKSGDARSPADQPLLRYAISRVRGH